MFRCSTTFRIPSRTSMNARAVVEMDAAEDSHWWYAGLQDLLRRMLRSRTCRLPDRPSVLDIGCGTGANLRVLAECLQPGYLGGFDVRNDCVARAREKCPSADVYESDVRCPELRCSAYDLIVCCDVLSDVGLDSCLDGLHDAVRRLAPGGLFLLHVPACSWLYSEHDAAVGTVQRFCRHELGRLYRRMGLRPDFIGYRMSLLFCLLAGSRLLRAQLRTSMPRSDLRRRSYLGDAICRVITTAENAAVCRNLCWPIGGSLIAIGRREA